jgi:hypothetical protein
VTLAEGRGDGRRDGVPERGGEGSGVDRLAGRVGGRVAVGREAERARHAGSRDPHRLAVVPDVESTGGPEVGDDGAERVGVEPLQVCLDGRRLRGAQGAVPRVAGVHVTLAPP